MSEQDEDSEVLWSHCNDCGRETKHDVVNRADRCRTHTQFYGEGDRYDVELGSVWQVLQCRGCEEVVLRRVDWCSEDDPMDGPNPATYFPPRVSRRKPPWANHFDLPPEYLGLLEEIYTALHADSRRLAMMGARALIDEVIRRNAGEQPNFRQGLDALAGKYLISEQDRGVIEAAIDLGHASMHRGHKPTPESLNVAIDIVERLVQTEILAEQAQELKRSTPPRPPRAARTKSSA